MPIEDGPMSLCVAKGWKLQGNAMFHMWSNIPALKVIQELTSRAWEALFCWTHWATEQMIMCQQEQSKDPVVGPKTKDPRVLKSLPAPRTCSPMILTMAEIHHTSRHNPVLTFPTTHLYVVNGEHWKVLLVGLEKLLSNIRVSNINYFCQILFHCT